MDRYAEILPWLAAETAAAVVGSIFIFRAGVVDKDSLLCALGEVRIFEVVDLQRCHPRVADQVCAVLRRVGERNALCSGGAELSLHSVGLGCCLREAVAREGLQRGARGCFHPTGGFLVGIYIRSGEEIGCQRCVAERDADVLIVGVGIFVCL